MRWSFNAHCSRSLSKFYLLGCEGMSSSRRMTEDLVLPAIYKFLQMKYLK